MEVGFTGYAIEQENQDYLRSQQVDAVMLMLGELPVRVDPRLSPLYAKGWLQTEDQHQQGSCEGNSLTENLEYCYPLATGGQVIQFSRQYAYIRSQMFSGQGGIRGDHGATLEGGTKAAKEGICTEAVGPYMGDNYPGWEYITPERKANASQYRLESITEIKSAEHYKQYLGSGVGCVQIGMNWNNYLQQTEDGFILDFKPTRFDGGHAIGLIGYITDEDAGRKSSAGWWALLKNSHSLRYAKKGWAYVDPRALDKMIAHPNTSCYGRSDLKVPSYRPLPVDWTKESFLG